MRSRAYILLILLLMQVTGFAAADMYNQPQVIRRYDMHNYDSKIDQIYGALRVSKPATMAERIADISGDFLGQPYLLGATGEGPDAEFDKGPLYRTDAFDCTTFVEMTLALAQAKNLPQFKTVIAKVRYKNGHISYVSRNHFISADWNKNNIKNGYMKDITSQLGVPYKVAYVRINKPDWFEKLPMGTLKTFVPLPPQQAIVLLRQLHARAKQVQVAQGQVKYIPLSELYTEKRGMLMPNKKVFAKIPSGVIIEFVIPDFNLTQSIGTHLDVVHMGLAIRTPQGLMFREASKIKMRVIDAPFVRYFQRDYVATQGLGGISVKAII